VAGKLLARMNGAAVARHVAPWCLFAALSIAATYPLVTAGATHIALPRGAGRSATVPLLNIWTLWWNVDRLEEGYRGYWDAPIYYPEPCMFAATEPQTVLGPPAWLLRQVSASWVSVYNLLLLAFLTLNGWIGYQLLRAMRLHAAVALCGGAMMITLPLVHWKLGEFQLISLWGILGTLVALVHFRRHPGPWAAVFLGVAFAVTYSLCCYHGLFLSVLLVGCAAPLLGGRLLERRTWMWLASAVLVSLLLLAPVLIAQWRFASDHPFSYPDDWIRQLSALPQDYLVAPWGQWLRLPELAAQPQRYAWPLSPGTLKWGAAAIGAVWAVSTRRRRYVGWFLLAWIALSWLLSMGPQVGWGDGSIYSWLASCYPGFARVRSMYRFAFFTQIGIILLAALALQRALMLLKRWLPSRHRGPLAVSLILLLGALLCGETWPARPQLLALRGAGRESRRESHWVDFLAKQGEQTVLMLLPLPPSHDEAAMLRTAQWMYDQTVHHQRMINGYVTVIPRHFVELRETMAGFPSPEAISALRQRGATHVVFDRYPPRDDQRKIMEAFGMTLVLKHPPANVEIWQLPINPSRWPSLPTERSSGRAVH